MTALPPGIHPESVTRLWFIDIARGTRSFERVYWRHGGWWIPRLRTTGELGVTLFVQQSDSLRAEAALLERASAAPVLSAAPAVTGRVQVAPFASVAAALQEVTRG